jgi:hypothetical protein
MFGIIWTPPVLLRHDQTFPSRYVPMSTATGVGLILTCKFVSFNCKRSRIKSTQPREFPVTIKTKHQNIVSKLTINHYHHVISNCHWCHRYVALRSHCPPMRQVTDTNTIGHKASLAERLSRNYAAGRKNGVQSTQCLAPRRMISALESSIRTSI